ncbi:MAG: universal stress protein [Alphaproteobacteria bacterium]|nr:universal stress protein [Alphaproteobacteria bacterium]
MSYKTLVTHWDGAELATHRLDLAVNLATRFDSHVIAVCFGILPPPPAYSYGGAITGLTTEEIEEAQTHASALADKARESLDRSSNHGETQPVICGLDGLAANFGARARYADLAIVGQPYGGPDEDVLVRVVEGALFDGCAATLVCPNRVVNSVGESILIAWNGSPEALRAVRSALPFLYDGKRIELLLVDPIVGPIDYGEEPGTQVALMLARRGLKVDVTRLPDLGKRTSTVIREHAGNTGADLLVMGAYGHSRFQEFVLGGVTRGILENVPIPVLMSH